MESESHKKDEKLIKLETRIEILEKANKENNERMKMMEVEIERLKQSQNINLVRNPTETAVSTISNLSDDSQRRRPSHFGIRHRSNEQSSDQFEEEFGDDLINDDLDLDENGILNVDEGLGLNESDGMGISDDALASNNNLLF